MEPEVKHDEKKSIFYIELDGEIAYLDYAMRGNKIDLYHTYTPAQLRGKGLAGRIVEFAFKYAKENNLKVIPSCPFIPSFLAKNPEYKKFVTD